MTNKPTHLGKKYLELTPEQKIVADREMDGTNFDCNKCGLIILRDLAMCTMGGKEGEIPQICYEYGSICPVCWQEWSATQEGAKISE